MHKIIAVHLGHITLVQVKQYVTANESESATLIKALERVFDRPVYLVSVDATKRARFVGTNPSTLRKLAKVNLVLLPWKQYRIS